MTFFQYLRNKKEIASLKNSTDICSHCVILNLSFKIDCFNNLKNKDIQKINYIHKYCKSFDKYIIKIIYQLNKEGIEL